MARTRTTTRTTTKRLARAYTALHEGQPPREQRAVRLPAPPKALIELGPIVDVVYEKDTPEGRVLYHHRFKRDARPVLAKDERGRLHVLFGAYTTTSHGIVDKPRRRARR